MKQGLFSGQENLRLWHLDADTGQSVRQARCRIGRVIGDERQPVEHRINERSGPVDRKPPSDQAAVNVAQDAPRTCDQCTGIIGIRHRSMNPSCRIAVE